MKGTLTISRQQSTHKEDCIKISVRDSTSRTQFTELSINCTEFTKALTGLAEQECDFNVFHLNSVGKKKITEPRKIICPIRSYTISDYEEWLKEHAQEEGYHVNTYLGSTGAIKHLHQTPDGKYETLLNYWVTKYVDPTD